MIVSESVEHLVNKAEMEDYESSTRPATCGLLDCFSAKDSVREKRSTYAHKRASRRIGMNKSALCWNHNKY